MSGVVNVANSASHQLEICEAARCAGAQHKENQGADGDCQADLLLIHTADLDAVVEEFAFHHVLPVH